jgi:hypothetical protein
MSYEHKKYLKLKIKREQVHISNGRFTNSYSQQKL